MTRYEKFRIKGRFAGLRRVCEVKGCSRPAAVVLGQPYRAFEVCAEHAACVIGLPAPARWL